jgi:hypothetical protein
MGRIRIRRLAMAILLMFACAPVEAHATSDCNVPHFHFVNEGVTSVNMWVRRGGGCQFHFESPASVYGVAGILASSVTLRPSNGLLGKNSIRIYAYKPKDDFVGSDEFELKIGYNRDDKTGDHETLLHVSVTVSP